MEEELGDLEITVATYAERWLAMLRGSVKARTSVVYELNLRRHLLPVLGSLKVRQLQKGQLRAFLADRLSSGLARATVRLIYATLRGMLNAAVDDGVILANPADRLGRQIRLASRARQEEIKALIRGQLESLLAQAAQHDPRFHPLFHLLARTGMRLGEARGLQWEDLDFQAGRSG